MKKQLVVACSVVVVGLTFSIPTLAQTKEDAVDSKQAGEGKTERPGLTLGSCKVSGMLQGWYQYSDGSAAEDTFRLRRAEIKLSGSASPSVAWAIVIDPAQVREDDATVVSISGTNVVSSAGRKSVLQDFIATFKPYSFASVDVGQYKVPFGMEGLTSSAQLDFIERSTMASQFKWADYRDIGVTCKGDFKIGNMKIQPSAGIYNGEGQNKLDANNPMAYAGRLVVEPIACLHVGVAYYDGATGSGEVKNNHVGGELKLTLDPVTVYGEYAQGESGGKDKATYYATLTCKLSEACQAAARYDWYDADKDTSDDAKTETSIGVNYFLVKNTAKLALNYVFRGEEGASVDDDVVRVLTQISF